MLREEGRRIESWLHLSPRGFQIVLLVFILFMGAAMLFVWSNIKAVRQAYEYQSLKRENQQLSKTHRLLVLERETLRSLYRIQYLAKNRIGMAPPEPSQTVTVFLQ